MTRRGAAPPTSAETEPARFGNANDGLARAAAIIDRLSAEYPAHASRDLERLERAATGMAGVGLARQFEEISRIAHDIRGQGTVFGYPLISRLATSLCLAMRSLEPQDGAIATIIRSHIAGMRALLTCGVTGANDPSARAIAAGLELMVRSRTGR